MAFFVHFWVFFGFSGVVFLVWMVGFYLFVSWWVGFFPVVLFGFFNLLWFSFRICLEIDS